MENLGNVSKPPNVGGTTPTFSSDGIFNYSYIFYQIPAKVIQILERD